MRVENENGWSDFSDVTYIEAAEIPNRPAAPVLITSTQNAMTLQFFKTVDNGGSEVTEYELYINDGDSTVEPLVKVASYVDN